MRKQQTKGRAKRRSQPASSGVKTLSRQAQDRQSWIADAQHILEAIRMDQVDALVIRKNFTDKIYALHSLDELEQLKTEFQAKSGRSDQALRQNRVQLEALAAQLVTVQEEERRRIARDLHDDTNQRLALLMMEINGVLGLPSAGRAIQGPLRKIQASLIELSEHLRRLAHQLHPAILDDLGLAIAVQRYAEEYAQRTGIVCDINIRNVPDSVPQDISTSLYRIMQECLGNTLKHARATRVVIKLSGSDGQAHLSIKDDGIGFEEAGLRNRQRGMGFVSMRERTRQLGGSFSVQSQPGQGTTISVKVPMV